MKEHKTEWLEDSTVIGNHRYKVKLIDGRVTISAGHVYYFNPSRFGGESVDIKQEALPWIVERLQDCLKALEEKEQV